MKKILYVSTFALMVSLMTGCATPYPMGLVYTELNLPYQAVAQSEVSYTKVGVAKATSVLGLVTMGDASQRSAIRNGQITKIKYVDYSVKNILGIYGEYTLTVYGD